MPEPPFKVNLVFPPSRHHGPWSPGTLASEAGTSQLVQSTGGNPPTPRRRGPARRPRLGPPAVHRSGCRRSEPRVLAGLVVVASRRRAPPGRVRPCLLYTSDAADDLL